ncbi:hypothetical protein N0V88_001158 [Collariella sp. IMI 366227]|nr:hypothetical protein N0V88_001158 [Collariella sp. IMI 366227]
MTQTITSSELAAHTTVASLWLAIDGEVYDFTEFAPTHPGGLSAILQHAGKDATAAYNAVHSPFLLKSILPVSKNLGRLSSPAPVSSTPSSPTVSKPPLSSLISVNDFRLAAHTYFPAKTLAFVSSAATDCHTHRRNSAMYSEITLRPRVMVDVSAPISLETTILGQTVASPIFAAPTSLGKTVHPDGEMEIARACKELNGIAQVVSTSASFSVTDVVRAAAEHPVPPDTDGCNPPIFLQLYVDKHAPNTEALLKSLTDPDNNGDTTKSLIKGVFLTVDAPVPGKREADERGVLYGLGYGKEGVKRVIEKTVLNDELVTTMKMCGVTSLDELHPGLLNTRAMDHLVPETAGDEHPYAKWRRSKM